MQGIFISNNVHVYSKMDGCFTLARLCLILTLLASVVTSDDVIVETSYGKLRGTSANGVNAFLGIPYAKPPIGNLRWQRPQPPLPWRPSILNATSLQPGCPQHGCLSGNPAMVCPKQTSESCLFMNIWSPQNATSLPVMVYIHGGNFVHLSASSPIYQGADFARKGSVVLVTLDYRLGVLGFLYTGAAPEDAEGNYGIRDQRLALTWVQQNIKYFGGDPTQVTLFGQSAGGQSIPIHMMSPDARSLFRSAIIESAPFDIPFKSPTEALYLASTIVAYLNCTDKEDNYMTCLRSKTADEIADAQLKSRGKPTSLKILEFFEPLGPFVDGDIVPMEPIAAIYKNKLQSMPVMIGTVSEEARIFVYEAWEKPVSLKEYVAVLFATYPRHVPDMLIQYPGTFPDNRDELARLGTDFIFTCATRNMSRVLVQHATPVHRYVFDHAFSFPGWGNFTYCEGHVCHGEEIAFVFHSADRSGFDFTLDEETLSASMIAYWTNFAYTGNPSTGPHKVPLAWPKYDGSDLAMLLQTPKNSITTNYLQDKCDFWDTLGYSA